MHTFWHMAHKDFSICTPFGTYPMVCISQCFCGFWASNSLIFASKNFDLSISLSASCRCIVSTVWIIKAIVFQFFSNVVAWTCRISWSSCVEHVMTIELSCSMLSNIIFCAWGACHIWTSLVHEHCFVSYLAFSALSPQLTPHSVRSLSNCWALSCSHCILNAQLCLRRLIVGSGYWCGISLLMCDQAIDVSWQVVASIVCHSNGIWQRCGVFKSGYLLISCIIITLAWPWRSESFSWLCHYDGAHLCHRKLRTALSSWHCWWMHCLQTIHFRHGTLGFSLRV